MAFEPNIPPIQVHLCVWGAPYGKIPDPFGYVWASNAPLGKIA
jgi:uncharacterized glyoxalase superfamily protein PhnB